MGEAVRAPFAGFAVLAVRTGDWVESGAAIGTVETVKMEAAVRSPAAGRIRVALSGNRAHVSGGDPLVWVEPGGLTPRA